ncbi:flagellin [Sporosarcina sp. Te-1]|uniref:flagellin N-terminal helical domain-containing protein n=1 Tax=Sporosarcina sp. Te-1 TaxID=2818390 RepID=UPI001A9EDE89|nr:flagellin [Sporosarcina sp. Te-1]QTD41184.1 flagellin [Sporosarcina sp. Te-1]
MRINHNIAALNTHRQLGANNTQASKNLEKLSSGLKINRAGDDAAGLAISEKMRGQIRGLDMASKNAQDGISLIQTAEGALNETHAILQRMRELAVQSGNDTNTGIDRNELQKEVDQLAEELSRIGNNTEFNTQTLLDGSFKGTFHIGANSDQNISLEVNDMRAGKLGVVGDAKATTTVTSTYTASQGDTTANSIVDGEYTVTANADGTTFDLVAADGTVVANGDLTDFIGDGTGTNPATEDLSFATALKVGDKVTVKGTTVTAQSASDVTSSTLEAGSFTVKANGANFDLVGSNGKVVATSTDGTSFTNDKGEEVLKTGTALAAGDTVKVGGINISDQTSANKAITSIQTAIDTVSAERSKLGAMQNRLEHTINNLGTSSENLTAAESRIRDVDMAKEMMEFTKNNILTQAAQAMLAQANQQPQGVLQLLR